MGGRLPFDLVVRKRRLPRDGRRLLFSFVCPPAFSFSSMTNSLRARPRSNINVVIILPSAGAPVTNKKKSALQTKTREQNTIPGTYGSNLIQVRCNFFPGCDECCARRACYVGKCATARVPEKVRRPLTPSIMIFCYSSLVSGSATNATADTWRCVSKVSVSYILRLLLARS